MRVSRGDVILLSWPFTDGTGTKVRPAVVIQRDDYNGRLSDTIVAAVTSASKRQVGSKSQVVVDITAQNAQGTGLRLSSLVQCENLLTVDCQEIRRVIGRFPADLMAQVDLALIYTLDL